MDLNELKKIFTEIIRSDLTGSELGDSVKNQLTPDVVSALYAVAKQHDLAHILSHTVNKYGLSVDDVMSENLQEAELIAVCRYELINYAYEQICEILRNTQVPYVPLKGAIIRRYYPEEAMRTSCDIDILIREEMIDVAVKALEKEGYAVSERKFHDISMYSSTNIHLELHFSLIENIEAADALLKDAWDYTVKDGEYSYRFTDEFFAFYQFAHMLYHFLSGGCGIRSLMDVWVLEHKMGIHHTQLRDMLEKGNLYKFAEEMSKLSDICFSEAPTNDFSDMLLTYILSGGMYGTVVNRNFVIKASSRGALSYLGKRFFLPYSDMAQQYPILRKLPILLPFTWIVRASEALFSKKAKNALYELKVATDKNDTRAKAVKEIYVRLGL